MKVTVGKRNLEARAFTNRDYAISRSLRIMCGNLANERAYDHNLKGNRDKPLLVYRQNLNVFLATEEPLTPQEQFMVMQQLATLSGLPKELALEGGWRNPLSPKNS
jgi:hypothetical protein